MLLRSEMMMTRPSEGFQAPVFSIPPQQLAFHFTRQFLVMQMFK